MTNELKSKLLAAQSAEEVAALVKADGQEITAEDAGHLWEEIKKCREQDGRQLSLDELESVSGGADRNWVTDGCAATMEYGSWCDSNDKCIVWDVTYEFQPTGHLCPNCGKNMYQQNTICETLLEAVKEAVAEKGVDAEIEYITDMEKIMEYGIMSTPALMVDNKVVSMGRVLKARDVLKLI